MKKLYSESLYVFFLISILVVILTGFHSCKTQSDNSDKSIFRYNENTGISSLDPAFSRDKATMWACNLLFNGLVQMDEDLKIEPCIAKRWTVSEDGKVYSFVLRDDIYFHDHKEFQNGKGRKVVANDFKFSFERLANPETASPGQWVLNYVSRDKKGELRVAAKNDSLLEIELSEPFPPFLSLLAMKYCSVVPFEVVEAVGKDFRSNPVGTGPFYFKYWKEGVKLVLRKNENYFEEDADGNKLPYLDAVAVSFIIDQQSSFLQFVQGKLDLISGLDAAYKDEILTRGGDLNPKYRESVHLITEPYLNTEFIGIYLDGSKNDDPLKIKLVRQALNFGFDRSKMMKYLRNNIGAPGIYGIVPSGMPTGVNDDYQPYQFNPGKAKDLLAQAGYNESNPLPELNLSTNSEYLDLCQYIQSQLATIGVSIKINVMPSVELRDQMVKGNLPMFRASWIADYPDEENYFSLFYSKNFSPDGPNRTHYSNPAFDKLYEAAASTSNEDERYGLYLRMNKILMEDAPFIILYYDQVLRFTHTNIEGLGSNPLNMLDLRRVKKK